MCDKGENSLPPCLIFIDKEGRWYHKGAEMIHREFIRAFYDNMTLDARGRYVINWNGKRCRVDVEDTAFVVRRVVFESSKKEGSDSLMLYLSDDSREPLAPDSLSVGKDNVLYCMVKDSRFPARFNRAAYYELAGFVREEKDEYYLPLNGKRYIIGR